MTQFQRNNRVEPLWRALTNATDALIREASLSGGITVVAVGGYGRAELSPHSDIDIVVLISAENGAQGEQESTALLQRLWDNGIAASHATRTVQETVEAALSDASIATTLLDARLVAGNPIVFRALIKRLKQEVFGKQSSHYVAEKLAERDLRHVKWGDSRFMLEPHIKQGKGALRDLQTLQWIDAFCRTATPLLSPKEWQQHRSCFLFFAAVRAHMHILRGRADERLTFDLQMEIAAQMKFSGRTAQQKAERLMRRYFQCVRVTAVLTRSLCAALEAQKLRPTPFAFTVARAVFMLGEHFHLVEGRLDFASPDILTQHADALIDLFRLASLHGMDIHPHAYQTLHAALPELALRLMFEGKANACFMQILLGPQPEFSLRRMNETGVLGALLPEFERIAGMMQYDGYHTYTVDEHLLVAVGNLHQIEQGTYEGELPIATKIVHEISDRAALYLAVLCHDTAKGMGGNHAAKGAALMARVAQRMGLNSASSDLACWLVTHQELMSTVAFKRNLDDPKTIADFVAIVQSPERLRLLLLLTVSDIMAVGPTIWNGWKGALLRALFVRAQADMGIVDQAVRPAAFQPSVAALISQWEQVPCEPAMHLTHDAFHSVTEITYCTRMTAQVFQQLAGALAFLGATIVKATIQPLDGKAALMVVSIQDLAGNSFAGEQSRLKKLPSMIQQIDIGVLSLAEELPKRRMLAKPREVNISTAVFIDNRASATATVIEVNARDRLGLLHDILGVFVACEVQLVSAQLMTYGSKAVDVFYIKDAYGHKIIHKEKLAHIQRILQAACNGAA